MNDALPEYSDYTVDELRNIERNLDREHNPELHWKVQVALAERENEEAVTRQPVVRWFRNWLFENKDAPRDYRWVFEHGTHGRDADAILMWWAARRQFWTRFLITLFLYGIVTFCGTFLLVGLKSILMASSSPVLGQGWRSIEAVEEAITAFCGLFGAVVILANVIYFGMMSIDVTVSGLLRLSSWKPSVLLFSLSLAVMFPVASAPTLVLLAALFK